MRDYLLRRLLLATFTIFLVTIIIFLLVQLIPGSAIEQMLAEMQYQYEDKDVAAMKEALGVDVPIYVQYGRWVGGLIKGDLGNSLWTGRPVSELLVERLPVSLELALLSMFSALILSLPIGVYSALRQDTAGDYVARTFAIVLISLPSFWIGTMIMVYPSVWWDWTPAMKYVPLGEDLWENFLQFMLPAFILGMYLSGTTMRMTRTMMLEVLRQDYIRTAWAKGHRERSVIVRHALKNALIPVVTLIGLMTPVLIGGTVVLEQIFNLPGVGRLLLEAISKRDYILLSGANLFVTAVVVFFNLMVDLTYGYLDPRIQYK